MSSKRWTFDPGSGVLPADAAREEAGVEMARERHYSGVVIPGQPEADPLPLVQMPLGERWQWVATVLKQMQEQQARDSVFITHLGHKVSAALETAQRALRHSEEGLAEVRKELAHWRETHADRLDSLETEVVSLRAGITAHDNALKQHGQQIVDLINAHNQVVTVLQHGQGDKRIVVPS